MKADAATEAAVRAVLDTFAERYARRDLEGLLALHVPDSDVMMYGTGEDEKRVGRAAIQAQFERDWAQTEASALVYGWTSVSATGSVAWAATDAIFQVKARGRELAFPVRITWLLERRGDQWLIVHTHTSFPAQEQEEGESFPAG